MSLMPMMPPYGQSDRFSLPPELQNTLGRFQMQGPLPVPQMPGGMDVAPGPRKKMSLWNRLQEVVSPYPKHLEGMVGPDDVKGARNQGLLAFGASMLESFGPSTQRTSLGQALGRGLQAGVGTYQGAVDNMTQRAMARQQMEAGAQGMDFNKLKMEGLKGDMARIARTDAIREQIKAKHGPMPADPAQREQYLTSVMNDLIQAGLVDDARPISEILKSGGGQKGQPTYELDRGDVIEIRDKQTNKVIETVKKGMSPRDTAAGADTRAAVQFERDANREGKLADDYFQRTRQIGEVAGFASVLEVSGKPALAGDPAAQMSVLFAIMKLNDPGSAVKEGEYAEAAKAAGVPEQLLNAYNKVQQGGRIPPEAVQRFMEQGKRMARSWKQKQSNFEKHFRQRAIAQKLNPDHVIIDYFAGMDLGEDAPVAPAGPPRFDPNVHLPPRSR